MQLAKRRDLTPRNFMHQVVEEWNKITSQTYMAMHFPLKRDCKLALQTRGGEPNTKQKLTKVIVL